MNSKLLKVRGPATTRTMTAIGVALVIAAASATLVTAGPKQVNAGTTPLVQTQNPLAQSGFANVVDAVRPAVVNIQISRKVGSDRIAATPEELFPHGSPFDGFMKRFFEGDTQKWTSRRHGQPDGDDHASPYRMSGVGSGFIIDDDGYIVTNDHVVGEAQEIKVTLDDGRTLEATLVARDPKTDLALIKVDASEGIPHVRFGESDDARVGDWVVAVGNPFGLGNTVTTGIVSARGRSIGSGPYDDYLQIDAPINKGNSGGPVFNLNGEVIGVNTAIFSPNGGNVGIGFAIPSEVVEEVVADLKEYGTVRRGWLGVHIQEVSEDMAASLSLPSSGTAIVLEVEPDSPAQTAGIRRGDVIAAVDGEEVKKMRDLPRLIARIDRGAESQLTIWRDGRERMVAVTIGRSPAAKEIAQGEISRGEKDENALGLALQDLNSAARRGLGLDDGAEGAVIAAIEPGSVAAKKGLKKGDLIVAVGKKPVQSAAEAVTELDKAKKGNKKAVLLLVRRDNGQRFIALPLRTA